MVKQVPVIRLAAKGGEDYRAVGWLLAVALRAHHFVDAPDVVPFAPSGHDSSPPSPYGCDSCEPA
jgi:hypothetical protein